jgi:hypothetical protein
MTENQNNLHSRNKRKKQRMQNEILGTACSTFQFQMTPSPKRSKSNTKVESVLVKASNNTVKASICRNRRHPMPQKHDGHSDSNLKSRGKHQQVPKPSCLVIHDVSRSDIQTSACSSLMHCEAKVPSSDNTGCQPANTLTSTQSQSMIVDDDGTQSKSLHFLSQLINEESLMGSSINVQQKTSVFDYVHPCNSSNKNDHVQHIRANESNVKIDAFSIRSSAHQINSCVDDISPHSWQQRLNIPNAANKNVSPNPKPSSAREDNFNDAQMQTGNSFYKPNACAETSKIMNNELDSEFSSGRRCLSNVQRDFVDKKVEFAERHSQDIAVSKSLEQNTLRNLDPIASVDDMDADIIEVMMKVTKKQIQQEEQLILARAEQEKLMSENNRLKSLFQDAMEKEHLEKEKLASQLHNLQIQMKIAIDAVTPNISSINSECNCTSQPAKLQFGLPKSKEPKRKKSTPCVIAEAFTAPIAVAYADELVKVELESLTKESLKLKDLLCRQLLQDHRCQISQLNGHHQQHCLDSVLQQPDAVQLNEGQSKNKLHLTNAICHEIPEDMSDNYSNDDKSLRKPLQAMKQIGSSTKKKGRAKQKIEWSHIASHNAQQTHHAVNKENVSNSADYANGCDVSNIGTYVESPSNVQPTIRTNSLQTICDQKSSDHSISTTNTVSSWQKMLSASVHSDRQFRVKQSLGSHSSQQLFGPGSICNSQNNHGSQPDEQINPLRSHIPPAHIPQGAILKSLQSLLR